MKPASPDVVRSVPLYARLGSEDLQTLTAVAEVQLFGRGETIFSEGEPALHFYTIVRGRVKVHKRRPDGAEIILTIFGEGIIYSRWNSNQLQQYYSRRRRGINGTTRKCRRQWRRSRQHPEFFFKQLEIEYRISRRDVLVLDGINRLGFDRS